MTMGCGVAGNVHLNKISHDEWFIEELMRQQINLNLPPECNAWRQQFYPNDQCLLSI
jgi:hypothetical protein